MLGGLEDIIHVTCLSENLVDIIGAVGFLRPTLNSCNVKLFYIVFNQAIEKMYHKNTTTDH